MKSFLIILLTFLLVSVGFAQKELERKLKGYTNPDELVTLSPSIPFDKAIELLSKVSENTTGRKIISTVSKTDPIGIQIDNMPYEKALLVISKVAGFIYEEKPDVIIVKRPAAVDEARTKENYADINSREVKISAVFFEMNTNELKQRGIDWKFLLSKKGLDVGGSMGVLTQNSGNSAQANPEFQIGGSSNFDVGGFFGQATAMFKFFENENLGELIASPNITVRDRIEADLQVGSDISIKQRDFAGNVIDQFFSTGTIIKVTPFVYSQDQLDYILLHLHVERSIALPSEVTTEIAKTSANTEVLMLNGEETIIGGLFTNEEKTVRTGIPILKDLPWWVFGIRYLTGTDEKTVTKKELVILIKAEIVPSLKERVAGIKSENLIKKEILDNRKKIKYYQFNQSQTNDN